MLDKKTLAGQVNTKQASITGFPIDGEGPSTSVTFKLADGNGYTAGSWSSQDIVQTLSGTDPGGSGISYYQYSENKSQVYTIDGTYTWTGDMNKSLYFRAVDSAGNVGDWIGPYSLMIDMSPPSQTTFSGGHSGTWVNYGYTVSLSSTDNVSGIQKYQVSTDNSNWSDCSSKITYSTEGNFTYYYRAVNGAGQPGASSVVNNVLIDTSPPEVTIAFRNVSLKTSGEWSMEVLVSLVDSLSGLSTSWPNSPLELSSPDYNGFTGYRYCLRPDRYMEYYFRFELGEAYLRQLD